MTKKLFSSLDSVSALISSHKRILLISDYDGTLAPIVKHPDLAQITGKQRAFLRELSRNRRIVLGLLSGRPLADLRRKVRIPGILYGGNHGFEIQKGSRKFVHPGARKSSALIRAVSRELSAKLKKVRGAWVENKGLTLSLHYRLVNPDDMPAFRRILRDSTAGHGRKIRVTSGKKVFEIRPPVKWDKGKAVRWFMKSTGAKQLPVYIGDDVTDEDAFRAIGKKGLSVHVGTGRTNAQYMVRNTSEVYRFLAFIRRETAE